MFEQHVKDIIQAIQLLEKTICAEITYHSTSLIERLNAIESKLRDKVYDHEHPP